MAEVIGIAYMVGVIKVEDTGTRIRMRVRQGESEVYTQIQLADLVNPLY
jgi:hypothetical protein